MATKRHIRTWLYIKALENEIHVAGTKYNLIRHLFFFIFQALSNEYCALIVNVLRGFTEDVCHFGEIYFKILQLGECACEKNEPNTIASVNMSSAVAVSHQN